MIKDGIDCRRHIVQNAGHIGDDGVDDTHQGRNVPLMFRPTVDVDKPLGMKRRPADEEGHHNCHCKKSPALPNRM